MFGFGKKKKPKAKKIDIHDVRGWVSPESLMSTDLPDAYHEGYDDCLMRGVNSEENPYTINTVRHYWWIRGYADALEEVK